MFLILEGELEIFIDSILIAVRGPGEYIGEMSMIDPKIRSASVKSTCKTELFEIDKGLFDSCLATNPTVVMEILKTVTNRSREDLAVLKQNNKELHEFTQIASHDLQEPLRKIMTFGERLKEKAVNLDGESLDCIERMQKSAVRMKRYIDDLLHYAKVEAQHTLFEKVDLQKKVKTVCEELDHIIHSTNGVVNISNLPKLECVKSQLYQLFINLIMNSFKFKKEGRAPVLNIFGRKKENGYWEISIEDNGIGFDEKYADRIFKPFQRLHARSKYEGSGLGLSICKKIVDQHNGSISVKSKPGDGATFIITLPEKQSKTQQ